MYMYDIVLLGHACSAVGHRPRLTLEYNIYSHCFIFDLAIALERVQRSKL